MMMMRLEFLHELYHTSYTRSSYQNQTIAFYILETILVNKMGIPEIVFNASHPFLFFVQDELTGTIIFVGKMTTPDKTSTKLDVDLVDVPDSRFAKDEPQVHSRGNELDMYVNFIS